MIVVHKDNIFTFDFNNTIQLTSQADYGSETPTKNQGLKYTVHSYEHCRTVIIFKPHEAFYSDSYIHMSQKWTIIFTDWHVMMTQ